MNIRLNRNPPEVSYHIVLSRYNPVLPGRACDNFGMIFRANTRFLAVSLVAVVLSLGPVAAQSQERKSRDNSGRQLAMVVPVPPAARPVVSVPALPPAFQQKAAEMTPQLKQMVKKGTQLAQGASSIAAKRAGDVCVWVSTMWHELNDTPQITPVREFSTPMPSASSMRPLEANQARRLYYTNERRLKTVVGR
jgi:hypothetical protein